MSKPRKPTPNQLAWQKEVARLQRAVKRAEKQGKVIPPNFIPETPKRITQKQLNLIKSISFRPQRQAKQTPRKPPRPKRSTEVKRTRTTSATPPTTGLGRVRHGKSEATKEKERIRSTLYRATKRGYEVPDMATILAAKPEGVSELDYLRSLKGDRLYEHFRYAIYRDAQGNTIYQTGVERRAEEAWERVQKGFATSPDRVGAPPIRFPEPPKPEPEPEPFEEYEEPTEEEILDATAQYMAHLRHMLDEFEPKSYWSDEWNADKKREGEELRALVERAIEEEGELVIAKRIEEAGELFYRYVDLVLYESDRDDVNQAKALIASIILGRSLTPDESESLTEDY